MKIYMRPLTWWAILLTLGLYVAGCVTDADRRVNDQNKKAGAFIEAKALQPEVKQAGTDVKLNSTTLEKNLLGAPQADIPYSAKASADSRKESDDSHSGGLFGWLNVLLMGATAVAGWASRAGLLRLLPTVFGGPVGAVATSVIEAITRAREKAQGNGGKIDVAELLALLSKTQEEAGVKKLAQDLAHRAEAELAAKL